MAPEIRTGNAHRLPAADLYSLAGVAHWLLTGEDPPYSGAHERVGPVLAEHGVGRELAAVVSAAMRPAAERPQWSAPEFLARLAAPCAA
ncbi:hypothetical protein [Streptomyces sp. NPDC048663]|uniref:hypothetical protein n=1 Tax=Streptomyces sp. NPDC048663 TaxID=3155638 RepID=UPI0034331AF3